MSSTTDPALPTSEDGGEREAEDAASFLRAVADVLADAQEHAQAGRYVETRDAVLDLALGAPERLYRVAAILCKSEER